MLIGTEHRAMSEGLLEQCLGSIKRINFIRSLQTFALTAEKDFILIIHPASGSNS